MEHRTLERLSQVAAVHSEIPSAKPLAQHEKLTRWTELLGREPGRRLATLEGTEYRSGVEQATMRADNSPLSVAFADPMLRGDGLRDDTYGEAKRYFELSDWELHSVVCYCHFGFTMRSGAASARVRSIGQSRRPFVELEAASPGLLARAWHALFPARQTE